MKFSPFLMILLFLTNLLTSSQSDAIEFPTGVYATEMGYNTLLENTIIDGVILHFAWKDLEPKLGQYDFSHIEQAILPIKKAKKQWILALHAGPYSPNFIKESHQNIIIKTSKGGVPIPKFWYGDTLEALRRIFVALGRHYKNDPNLAMVIIPQMTHDGLTMQFKGGEHTTTRLKESGYSDALWQDALLWSLHSAIAAFPNTAIGVDLGRIAGTLQVTHFMLRRLDANPKLSRQVIPLASWLNGKDRNDELVTVFSRYGGPTMGLVSTPSKHRWAFNEKGYATIFPLAQRIGMRAMAISSHEFYHQNATEILTKFRAWIEKIFEKENIEGRR